MAPPPDVRLLPMARRPAIRDEETREEEYVAIALVAPYKVLVEWSAAGLLLGLLLLGLLLMADGPTMPCMGACAVFVWQLLFDEINES